MSNVRENFRAQPMGINASVKIGGSSFGGFLAKTAGTITLTDADGTILVDAVPLTAGIYTPLPFRFNTSAGATILLGGGASGTAAV